MYFGDFACREQLLLLRKLISPENCDDFEFGLQVGYVSQPEQ